MRYINLTQGKVTIIDDEDYDMLMQYKWFAVKNKKQYYAKASHNGKPVWLHRLLAYCPDNMFVDHADRNGLNNQKINLRVVNNSQNNANRNRSKSERFKYKYKGIYNKNSKKMTWHARIKFNYKEYHLGTFYTQEEAALAYNIKAIELFGEYANLNIIT